MTTFKLTVREHERVPVMPSRTDGERVLLPREVDVLLGACRGTGETPFTVGHRSVKFNHRCGVIQGAGVSVEILPKVADIESFDRGLMLQMLACAARIDVARMAAGRLDFQRHTLLEILLQWFCTEVSAQCHAGLLREYVTHSDDLPVIRGRWRPDLDIRHGYSNPARLSCEFDELVANNRYNQALKAALRSARALASGSVTLSRQLNQLLSWFADVDDRPVSAIDVERLPRNRLVARYGPALDMATWLLARRAPDLRHGDKNGFAMLFDMNFLFQACLGRLLLQSLPQTYRLREEGPRYFLSLDRAGHKRFQMKPDFCILAHGKVVAIIDAKWKRLVPAMSNGCWGVQQADMYQLHAYATAYECSTVALWYPAHADTEIHAERPAFRFITNGKDPAPGQVAVDWISLFQDLKGKRWIESMTANLAVCLQRMGISPLSP
jgi:5-methylcytosine-specific restriction enzyme subunit McrC